MVTNLQQNEISLSPSLLETTWQMLEIFESSEMVTGNISVMSSPSGFKISPIFRAHADRKSGSIAQKNLFQLPIKS